MMVSDRIFSWLAAAVICPLLLVAGCGSKLTISSTGGGSVTTPGEGSFHYDQGSVQEVVATPDPGYLFIGWTGTAVDAGRVADPDAPGTTVTVDAGYTLRAAYAAALALKFTPQDSATYRLITERERSVEAEGALLEDKSITGGRTGSRVEITFTQQIQSVDENGNAVAEITIKQIKHLAREKDITKVNFDSAIKGHRRNPMAKLIGQSYTIRISPAGKVVGVIDVRQAKNAVRGRSEAYKAASALIEPRAIEKRHTIPALPPAGRNNLRPGDNWSSTKTFSYGMMGMEAYERIYTLKEISDKGGHWIAAIEMNAIPSSEMAERLHKEKPTSAFSEMFDSTQTYNGRLKLNLTAGKVEECFEKLSTQWIVVDPSFKQGGGKKPDMLKMGVIRLYSLERID
jgi:hypothetical protein